VKHNPAVQIDHTVPHRALPDAAPHTHERRRLASVTLLVPVLNEIQGVREIMPRVRREWCDQILVVDGGSTDGTVEYFRQRGYPVVAQRRPGMRFAFLDALPQVTGDIIIEFSPEGNSIPEVIPALVAKMQEGYDMVIVSRYREGARSEDDDFVSGLANLVFTRTINLLFRARYTDAMVMYRAYRRSLIEELELDKERSYWPEEALFHKRVGWEPLLSIRAAKRRLRIAEIPGSEPARIGGSRKLHVLWGLAYIVEIAREIFWWR
jgi:glycosyltransferase involved in cell wall biosynthesis